MWSTHAFSVEEIEKLYIGAAMTTTSAASTSAISASANAAAARCSAVRDSAGVATAPSVACVRCGMVVGDSTRSTTVVPGCARRQAATNSAPIRRDFDASANRLEVTNNKR